jgi:hypothetical protein
MRSAAILPCASEPPSVPASWQFYTPVQPSWVRLQAHPFVSNLQISALCGGSTSATASLLTQPQTPSAPPYPTTETLLAENQLRTVTLVARDAANLAIALCAGADTTTGWWRLLAAAKAHAGTDITADTPLEKGQPLLHVSMRSMALDSLGTRIAYKRVWLADVSS